MRRAARWLAFALLWAGALAATPAGAQDEAPDAGAVVVRRHVERPPEGSMRRGPVPVPGWAVWICGGLIVAGSAGALAWRLKRSGR
ncbi:MAG TPA: hypothetical protein RMH99_31855 [Sandaracinaceae bacterium LLY-WYZ-13_1]|nr:hypothetical protein [Sandaracinaceae bacterium LLY-WYZ-13_1]